MKTFLKKLQKGSNQSEDSEGSTSSSKGGNNKLSDVSVSISISSPDRVSSSWSSEHNSNNNNPLSAISGWLNSVKHHRKSPSPPSSSNLIREERITEPSDSCCSSGVDVAFDAIMHDSGSNNSRDPDIEEEYQIQLALEISAREDPEAVQIEAVKQISLGSCPPDNTPAEVTAYRYWNYNALGYDDKILDGFYDLYGILTESSSSKMPSLGYLQGTPVSESLTWEVVIVNRAGDSKLLNLEGKALSIAMESRLQSEDFVSHELIQKLAVMVSDHMGGPVGDPEKMLLAWRSHCNYLKENLRSMVLPLGSLSIGLARHRALLFKVLADSVGVPCRLVKGQLYTGSNDAAINFVKMNDGREYIVDLMADPGTLIPSDIGTTNTQYDEPVFIDDNLSQDVISLKFPRVLSSVNDSSEVSTHETMFNYGESSASDSKLKSITCVHVEKESEKSTDNDDSAELCGPLKTEVSKIPSRPNHPYSHARSPSWTEGVSSPSARKKKVKDVSQLMIDAAKENPGLAQKLHDVLLESGVVAPPHLFTEIYPGQLNTASSEGSREKKEKSEVKKALLEEDNSNRGRFLPPLPHRGSRIDEKESTLTHLEVPAMKSPTKNVPIAAAAAAAAVVASSMVAAVAKTSADSKLELPVSAAATATAAAVVATTAAVTQNLENIANSPDGGGGASSPVQFARTVETGDVTRDEQRGSGNQDRECLGTSSDKVTENFNPRSAITLDDVADCEIPWEDIILGDRIGLGSYGEVYHGDWHGTEVAVKRFLDQDITDEFLEVFRSEVWIMKKLRHPNIVLFMGAVTRPPNLSIVTEFLPRGSLYRLLHRPNSQLDERRRLRMALDAARGMNYLHNCTPVIVHRDLKSPNLLVDKNWVVKVCDFGLSRLKHSTFLSSRSTAGTAEWMAPEVLRNEPSNEKCDVYSYGVILWELCTLQQPWGGMNPMQVVGAVGFQHRRLEIPDHLDPAVASIIDKCWQTDPKVRPSFAEIIAALKPLQKPITASSPSSSSQAHRRNFAVNRVQDRVQSSRFVEDDVGPYG